MSEKLPKPERVLFTYVKPDGYQIFAVNGVYGGITPRGDFLLHFFYEYRDVPDKEKMQISEEGKLVPSQRPIEEEAFFRRDMKVGITMNLEQAVSIANFILEKVKAFKESREKPE